MEHGVQRASHTDYYTHSRAHTQHFFSLVFFYFFFVEICQRERERECNLKAFSKFLASILKTVCFVSIQRAFCLVNKCILRVSHKEKHQPLIPYALLFKAFLSKITSKCFECKHLAFCYFWCKCTHTHTHLLRIGLLHSIVFRNHFLTISWKRLHKTWVLQSLCYAQMESINTHFVCVSSFAIFVA